jgi:hypothetical protein
VKQMAKIYSRARNVIAWLGPCPSEDIEASADDLLQLGEVAEDLVSLKDRAANWDPCANKAEDLFRPGSKPFLALIEICSKT